MNFLTKLEEKNDRKHDLILAGAYLAFMLISLAVAAGIMLLEPGDALGKAIENILYVVKIAIVASLGFFALYCLIKSISSILYIFRRK